VDNQSSGQSFGANSFDMLIQLFPSLTPVPTATNQSSGNDRPYNSSSYSSGGYQGGRYSSANRDYNRVTSTDGYGNSYSEGRYVQATDNYSGRSISASSSVAYSSSASTTSSRSVETTDAAGKSSSASKKRTPVIFSTDDGRNSGGRVRDREEEDNYDRYVFVGL
jgi:hypothetical protein